MFWQDSVHFVVDKVKGGPHNSSGAKVKSVSQTHFLRTRDTAAIKLLCQPTRNGMVKTKTPKQRDNNDGARKWCAYPDRKD